MIGNNIKSPQFSNGEQAVKQYIEKLQKYIVTLEKKLIVSDRKLKKEKSRSQELELLNNQLKRKIK